MKKLKAKKEGLCWKVVIQIDRIYTSLVMNKYSTSKIYVMVLSVGELVIGFRTIHPKVKIKSIISIIDFIIDMREKGDGELSNELLKSEDYVRIITICGEGTETLKVLKVLFEEYIDYVTEDNAVKYTYF